MFCLIDTSSADGQLCFPLWFHTIGDNQGKITSNIMDAGIDQRVSWEEAARASYSMGEGEAGVGGDSKAGMGQWPHWQRHSPTIPEQEEQSRSGDCNQVRPRVQRLLGKSMMMIQIRGQIRD